MDSHTTLVTYIVTLQLTQPSELHFRDDPTILGLDVPSMIGPKAAARRAIVTAAALGWADLDRVRCVSSVNPERADDSFTPDVPALLIEIESPYAAAQRWAEGGRR